MCEAPSSEMFGEGDAYNFFPRSSEDISIIWTIEAQFVKEQFCHDYVFIH